MSRRFFKLSPKVAEWRTRPLSDRVLDVVLTLVKYGGILGFFAILAPSVLLLLFAGLLFAGLLREPACFPEVVSRYEQLSDFRFEVREADCSDETPEYDHDSVRRLVVRMSSRSRWLPGLDILTYWGRGRDPLVVQRIDGHTVRISFQTGSRAMSEVHRSAGITLQYDVHYLPGIQIGPWPKPRAQDSKPPQVLPSFSPKDVPPVYPTGERPLDKR